MNDLQSLLKEHAKLEHETYNLRDRHIHAQYASRIPETKAEKAGEQMMRKWKKKIFKEIQGIDKWSIQAVHSRSMAPKVGESRILFTVEVFVIREKLGFFLKFIRSFTNQEKADEIGQEILSTIKAVKAKP